VTEYNDFSTDNTFGLAYKIPLKEISSLTLTNSKNFKDRLALLFTMMQEMNHIKDEEKLFDLAIDYTGRILNVDRASICIMNRTEKNMTFKALYGVSAEHPKSIVMSIEGTAIGKEYLKDFIIYRPSISNSTCKIIKVLYAAGLNSTMTAPIICGGIRFGTLNTACFDLDAYNNDEIHLFAQITAILGTHLHNIQLQNQAKLQQEALEKKNKELESLVHIDPLTKIYNRRHINNILTYEILQSERKIRQLSLIMIDIDYFKKVNDKLGHLVGDTVLCELVSLIGSNIRKNDIFARWGGEEFLIACIDTSLYNTSILAENLRIKIQNENNKNIQNITISLGVGSFETGDTIDTLIQKVDNALYESKVNGRNRVSISK
jgi:diguanylate cyclase (GGDEF)-like protein